MEYFKLEQRSVMRLFVAENCKSFQFTEECMVCTEKYVLAKKKNYKILTNEPESTI